jgi:hypothetical protein
LRGLDDTAGDFAPIGDQDLLKHGCLSLKNKMQIALRAAMKPKWPPAQTARMAIGSLKRLDARVTPRKGQ